MITSVDSSLEWRKSSMSAESNCVEVALSGHILVRDSKDQNGSVLNFSAACWTSFLDGGNLSLSPNRP
ncbi:DUF397 domain-containing protein [Streptomyces sp. NPDC048324]|uniref:DUF397 domain-containing protein n=1 Tax=Streptomyces sp. NPDC048324 TaxID=3157205 RepID=UPI00343E5EB1